MKYSLDKCTEVKTLQRESETRDQMGIRRSEGCLKKRELERRMYNVSVVAIAIAMFSWHGWRDKIHLERRREDLYTRRYS